MIQRRGFIAAVAGLAVVVMSGITKALSSKQKLRSTPHRGYMGFVWREGNVANTLESIDDCTWQIVDPSMRMGRQNLGVPYDLFEGDEEPSPVDGAEIAKCGNGWSVRYTKPHLSMSFDDGKTWVSANAAMNLRDGTAMLETEAVLFDSDGKIRRPNIVSLLWNPVQG